MAKYKCDSCQKNFVSYNKNPQFCSLKCKGDFQAPSIDINNLKALYESGMTQEEVGKVLGVSQKSVFKAMRRNGVVARVASKRDQFGDKNHRWKGDNATRVAFHRRLYSRFGKPTRCSVCGTQSSKNYDYANLTGKYEDIEDYAPMCRSCHWKFDDKVKNIENNRKK